MSAKLKIRVGINPFEEQIENWEQVVSITNEFAQSKDVTIIPTFLLSSETLETIHIKNTDSKEWLDNFAKTQITSFLLNFETKAWSDPEVISSEGRGVRSGLQKFGQFLNNDKCDLFIANTHARKGLKRFFLGSFAENLLLYSSVPMLFITPNTKPHQKIKKILFPTDFSPESREAFNKLISNKLCKGDHIELFSKTLYPFGSTSGAGSYSEIGPGWESVQKYIEDSKREKDIASKDFIKAGFAQGYSVNYSNNDDTKDLTTNILEHAQETNCDLIALGSFYGTNESIFTSSQSRDIVRSADLPVLIWHLNKKGS